MNHIRRITVAKASENEGDDDSLWPIWDPQAILDILGGSIQDVLLSIIDAKGKGSGS